MLVLYLNRYSSIVVYQAIGRLAVIGASTRCLRWKWRFWISHFEIVSAAKKWSDEEKLLWLCVKLTGKAHVAYVCLSHVIQPSYLLLKEALLKRFEPFSNEMLYKIKFNDCKKKENEMWG